MDKLDCKIINLLQTGFPLIEEPYVEIATQLGITEHKLLNRLFNLLEQKILTRFGPLYDIQKIGGAFSLVAMQVPDKEFDIVVDLVNSYPEVAHNYQRDHLFNMWYVLATETSKQINEVNCDIEQRTGLKVFNMPKLDEYYIGLKLVI